MKILTRTSKFSPARSKSDSLPGPGFFLAGALFFLAGCGDGGDSSSSSASSSGDHWTAKYRAFGGSRPADHTDLNWMRFLDRPMLGEVKIAAPSVMTAFTELNSQTRKAGAKVDLVVVPVEPDFPNFNKAIDLTLDDPTVAGVIDAIVRQAGKLAWDFQGETLVVRPAG